MKLLKEFESAIGEIRHDIQQVLTGTAPAAREIAVQTANTDVYGAYSPEKYQRRGSSGGLGDPDKWEVKVDEMVLTVTNRTPAQSPGVNVVSFAEQGNEQVPGRPFMATIEGKVAEQIEMEIENRLGD